ncbi:MAG: flagellar hook protein FlgE [Planctomycetales bacterium]|nr:flagellar hook protein FlgE [Planctomycetales bacterium]
MSNSLTTGVSGLNAHQQMLNVIGNNLANVNTVGYKARRMMFADLLYQTLRPASGPNSPSIGGINPMQTGSGVQTAQVDMLMTQGEMNQTGQPLDFAINGDGYFVLRSGQEIAYTRAGAFALDANGRLVDPSTGFEVQRTTGEAGLFPSFQSSGDSGINIPLGANIPGQATTLINLAGNLSAVSTGPVAHEIETSSPLTASGSPAVLGTLLNDLDSNISGYIVGDAIELVGFEVSATPLNVTVPVDATTTVGDLVSAISGAFPNATASLDATGHIVVTADVPGASSMVLNVVDASGNTGGTDFGNHLFNTSIAGKEADSFTTTVEIYDTQGTAHSLTMTFEKQSDNSWNLSASIPSGGTLTDSVIEDIRFNDDGSLQQVAGTGLGDANFTIQFDSLATPQTIQFNFGDNNSFNGVTQVATSSSVSTTQDGYAPGVLTTISVDTTGLLQGVATNGIRFPIAQLAIASFRNPKGLLSTGNNYLQASANSGQPEIGLGNSGSRGAVTGLQLEASNVDIANEFTLMIVAQRGFSANARTITVTDEVLEELTNIIR